MHVRAETAVRGLNRSVITVTSLVAALASAVAAFLDGWLGGVLGALALVLIAVVIAVILAPRRAPLVFRPALLLAGLTVLLVVGFVLRIIDVRLDHRSVSLALAVLALVIAVLALTNERFLREPVLSGDEASTPDGDGDPSVRRLATLRPTGGQVAAVVVLALLAASAIVIAYVSDNAYRARNAFVSLSIARSKLNDDGTRTIVTEIANHGVKAKLYKLTVTTRPGTTGPQVQLTVPSGSTVSRTFQEPATSAVIIRLYRSDVPKQVYRQVLLRAAKS